VVTLGNPEFDYGLPHLLFREKMANFPIVNANLYIKPYGKRLMKPFHILNVDGLSILFIGIITEKIMASLARDQQISGFISLADADRGSTAKLVRAMPAYWLDVRGAHHSAMKRPAPSRRRLRGRVRRYR